MGPTSGGPADLLFDARHIHQSGIGTYIGTLLPELEAVFADRGLSLAILAAEHAIPEVHDGTTVIVDGQGASMYSLGEQRVWSSVLKALRPRGMWIPHYTFPLAALKPSHRGTLLFVTVHDTLHVMEQRISGQNGARRAYARTMLGLDVRRCRTIFTPSQATAAMLPSAKGGAHVEVSPIPVDERWFLPVDAALSPVREPFILYVGNAKWHKNLPLLLTAYAEVADQIPHRLVIAGSGESLRGGDDRVPALAAAQGDRVEVMGRLDFDVLRSLMSCADLLVMPSLHEGAGLPPIEAMACRTAVLASDIAALRETCGAGADYFDPNDAGELAGLLVRLGRDEQARAALAERGWSHVTARQAGLSLRPSAASVADELGAPVP
ncbi:glycosyltransferase family 4 protein [Mycolicibacterium hippocampi]|uniref:glycosyltransferase family 4 protein n=1 Tax=Mycolicibacterium hippocampi TaxID=659824 RepID=UPI0035170AA3